MKISIVLPIYNEEKNIKILYQELKNSLNSLGKSYEIICVNDGSTDGSEKVLKELALDDAGVKVINFKHNFGQTAAMSAGISHATGDIIMPMDSDLQNDPADILKFLDKIEEGFDVVSGWRKKRWQGNFLTRKLPSVTANWMISAMTKVRLHDYGCSMKAYKREAIQGVALYGEMHRFIPAYIAWHGGKVAEIIVNCRPRIHGETKYGISRTFKVLLDLIVVKFLANYMNRPIHFFGGAGFISLFFGIICGLTALFLRLFHIKYIIETPLPILSALLTIVGIQLIAMGIIAEMIMRTYYESQEKTPYVIKEKINF
jgi:glycosyltransferase involved in cell wall biosynthesis